MSKYVDRILEEVYFNYERHFHDKEERVEFLEELIEELKYLLENLNDDECGVCTDSRCDCEPESCL